jgi:DNA/RNA-binding domain of Phe-tRNA-synthetase-like protein
MAPSPFPFHSELPGWELAWARLEVLPGGEEPLAALRLRVAERARAALDLGTLGSHPTVAALRRLFKAAGCDPARYRPSSEALLRRILKGEALPAIHPLVDLNNALSIELAVPSCVMAEGTITPPLVLRAGQAGEVFDSLRGPFPLAGKPLLADTLGPFGTPITDSQRVKVREGDRRAWMVAYLPRGVLTAEAARNALNELLAAAPVARLEETGASR